MYKDKLQIVPVTNFAT